MRFHLGVSKQIANPLAIRRHIEIVHPATVVTAKWGKKEPVLTASNGVFNFLCFWPITALPARSSPKSWVKEDLFCKIEPEFIK